MKYILLITSLILSSIANSSLVTKSLNQDKKIQIQCSENNESPIKTTPERVLKSLQKIGHDVKVEGNSFQLQIKERPIYMIYDVNADRIRIVSPIASVKDLTTEQITKAMNANFHTVLDARYAISNEVLWSVFVHPLSELSEKFLISATNQVYMASLTFGTQYSSGELVFPKPNELEK